MSKLFRVVVTTELYWLGEEPPEDHELSGPVKEEIEMRNADISASEIRSVDEASKE